MKLPDWHHRLIDEIKAAETRPFSYGEEDCLQFVARCYRAMTGVDHAAQFSYASESEAQQLLDARGGMEGFITSLLGPPIRPAEALPGDVGVALLEHVGLTACICLGSELAFVEGRRAKRALLVKAWRVP